ncbi:fimbrial biogenesis chaperone [Pantoea ananatis]|uniref:fimbrial biogenesis chaperone n=1 Tax=Pantoea ananas TaxID=553 RepID=UPI003C29DD9E
MSRKLNIIYYAAILFIGFTINARAEGGITIQGTRLIYPLNQNQLTLSISNTSAKDSFLVQSWVEDWQENKTKDILVVPPLYLSSPEDENLVRLVLLNKNLPIDRETLYYFVAKGIPSIDESKKNESAIRIALASRIKLFVRPDRLPLSSDDAQKKLNFLYDKDGLIIKNTTPYYITIVDMWYGKRNVKSIMIPPFSEKKLLCNYAKESKVSFSTINDYGATTKKQIITVK